MWIMKTRNSKYSFAVHSVFAQMSEQTLNDLKTYSHKPAWMYSSKPRSAVQPQI